MSACVLIQCSSRKRVAGPARVPMTPAPPPSSSSAARRTHAVPDFRKLHEQWSAQLEKGLAAAKKGPTVPLAFSFETRAKPLPLPVPSSAAPLNKQPSPPMAPRRMSMRRVSKGPIPVLLPSSRSTSATDKDAARPIARPRRLFTGAGKDDTSSRKSLGSSLNTTRYRDTQADVSDDDDKETTLRTSNMRQRRATISVRDSIFGCLAVADSFYVFRRRPAATR